MTTARAAAFTAAHGMVDRVHGNAPYLGPASQPATTTGFAQRKIFMLCIPQLPDGGNTVQQDHANLTGWQLDQCIAIFLGHQLGVGAGAANNLTALAATQLYVVNLGTQRDIAQGQSIARLDVRFRPGLDHIVYFKVQRCKNIALFTVGIVQQRYAG